MVSLSQLRHKYDSKNLAYPEEGSQRAAPHPRSHGPDTIRDGKKKKCEATRTQVVQVKPNHAPFRVQHQVVRNTKL